MRQMTCKSSRRALRGLPMLALAGVVAVAGCGSAPPPRFHSLLGAGTVSRSDASMSAPGSAPSLLAGTVGAPAQRASAAAVGAFILEPIRMPASVDQPQWMVRLPDDSLVSLESERWASPLRDEFRQAVLVELVGRFGLIDARDDRAFVSAAWRVRIDVLRFESISGREARIEGAWTLTPPSLLASALGKPVINSGPVHCAWRYAEPVVTGMPALAAAHRKAVSRLADAVGESLTRLQRGEVAVCAGA